MNKFKIGKRIGSGVHGTVNIAVRKRDKLAGVLKKVTETEHFDMEVTAYKEIGPHPGIAKFYESFGQSPGFLFLEHIKGNNLKNQYYVYSDIADIIRQLISIFQHIHKQGYVYLDIKESNILEDNGKIKLIDFSLSEKTGGKMAPIGTIYFMPPEMINRIGSIQPTIDIWALGVLTYILAFDSRPFDYDDPFDSDEDSNGSEESSDSKSNGSKSKTSSTRSNSVYRGFDKIDSQILDRITSGIFTIPECEDADLIDFIKKLLVVDPTRRMSLEDALKHKFLTKTFPKED